MKVQSFSSKEAADFIKKYHYSATMPGGKNDCFGLWLDTRLYAVAVYGFGDSGAIMGNAEVFFGKLSGLKNRITKTNLYELKRLARLGERGQAEIPLTAFLAKCHCLLREKGIRFIFSFSDPEHDHNGGIYKASNFFCLGQTAPEVHYVGLQGEFVHRRKPYKYMKSQNIKLARERYPEEFKKACEQERLQLDFILHLGRRWPKITEEIKARQAKELLGAEAIPSYTAAAKLMGLKPRKTQRKTRWFLPLFKNDFRITARYLAAQLQEAPKVPPSEAQFEAAVPLQGS